MKTVLIVDDERIVLDVLQRILMRMNYESVVVESGALALKRFNREFFDLVLLDVLMPDMNGFEIARQIRKVRPDQKIVMVTGLGEDAVIKQARYEHVEVDNVLSKPFSFRRVQHVVGDALGKQARIAS